MKTLLNIIEHGWGTLAASLLLLVATSANLTAAEIPAEIPPASTEFSCPAGLVPTTPTSAPSPLVLEVKTPRHRERSCFVTADIVAKQTKSGSVTLVDVRLAEDFEKFRIPGALNIPLHLLKTKSFLKTANIVLVNEGRSSRDLEESCRALKQAGFSRVSILDGGLHAWHERKQPVEGDPLVSRSFNKLKTSELFFERAYDDWVAINLSAASGPDSRQALKALPRKVVTLKTAGKTVPTTEIRNAIRAQRLANPNAKIAIIADTDAIYSKLEQELRGSEYVGVFYLAGGLAAYQQHVAMQVAIRHEADKPAKLASCRG